MTGSVEGKNELPAVRLKVAAIESFFTELAFDTTEGFFNGV
jgi:hypothetical protein